MAKDNLSIVSRLFEGWAIGDFSVGLESFDPHVLLIVRIDAVVGEDEAREALGLA